LQLSTKIKAINGLRYEANVVSTPKDWYEINPTKNQNANTNSIRTSKNTSRNLLTNLKQMAQGNISDPIKLNVTDGKKSIPRRNL